MWRISLAEPARSLAWRQLGCLGDSAPSHSGSRRPWIAITLLVGVTFAPAMGDGSQLIDVSGYWRVSDSSGNEEPRLVEVRQTGQDVTATFVGTATSRGKVPCPAGGDSRSLFLRGTLERDRQLGGRLYRCPSQRFVDTCTNVPDSNKVYQVRLSSLRINKRATEISGDFTNPGFRVETGEGGSQKCFPDSSFAKTYELKMERVSCTAGSVEQDNGEMAAYRQWLRGQTSGGLIETIKDGAERALAARCLPDRLIGAFRWTLAAPRDEQACATLCRETATWMRDVADNLGEAFPFTRFYERCFVNCPGE